MKKLKRTLSLFLTLAMVLVLAPAAFAADAPHDVDMGAVQPDSWKNGGELSSVGSKITLNGVIGQSTATFQEQSVTCYDVVVGGGFTLDMNFPKECTRQYSVMLDPVAVNGDTIDMELWPIEEYSIISEEDHKDQYVFTCTDALVGKPGSDMMFEFYVSWWEAPLGGDQGPSGGVDFWLRVHPASEIENIAYPSPQTVDLDGKKVEFQMYALKDAAGNPTNYVKVRDLALALNGTKAKFSVDWDGAVNLVAGKSYTAIGTENSTPFSGERAYKTPTAATNVNGAASDLTAIVLTDDSGGNYTYYQLRDLGRKLGFNVGWSAEKGVYIESDKPYQG